jgi:hypothetical protein
MAISEEKLRALMAGLRMANQNATGTSPGDCRLLVRCEGAIVELLAAMGADVGLKACIASSAVVHTMRQVGWGELSGDRLMAFSHTRDDAKGLSAALFVECALQEVPHA